MSDLERVVEHYTQDRDAGHEEPRAISYADLLAPEVYKGSALEVWDKFKAEWGAERYLYSRQLQDANKRIHELEQELLKLREELKALTSGQTVSVPLSAWNKLCAEAAKARPLAEEEPEAFPARALRFSV